MKKNYLIPTTRILALANLDGIMQMFNFSTPGGNIQGNPTGGIGGGSSKD